MIERGIPAEEQIAEILFSAPNGNLTSEQHQQISALIDQIRVPHFRDRAKRAMRARAVVKEELPLGERVSKFLRSVTHR